MTATDIGELIVYISDGAIDNEAVSSIKREFPNAMVLADVLEPLYDTSIATREASQKLGRMKAELETMVHTGVDIVVLCQRRNADLGTRAHFVASLCASADRVHFL